MCTRLSDIGGPSELELEYELIQSYRTQKPVLRNEVDARVRYSDETRPEEGPGLARPLTS